MQKAPQTPNHRPNPKKKVFTSASRMQNKAESVRTPAGLDTRGSQFFIDTSASPSSSLRFDPKNTITPMSLRPQKIRTQDQFLCSPKSLVKNNFIKTDQRPTRVRNKSNHYYYGKQGIFSYDKKTTVDDVLSKVSKTPSRLFTGKKVKLGYPLQQTSTIISDNEEGIQYDNYSKKIMSMKVNRKDFGTINGQGHFFEESPKSKIPKYSVKSLQINRPKKKEESIYISHKLIQRDDSDKSIKQGITQSVQQLNQKSMQMMQLNQPKTVRRNILDLHTSFNNTKNEVLRAHAILGRVLTNQDEKIKELEVTIPNEYNLIKDIPLNLRIRVENKLSPLKLHLTYPVKSLSVYLSFENKEPNDSECKLKYFNPSRVLVEANDKKIFSQEWLYVTLESYHDTPIVVAPKFEQKAAKFISQKKDFEIDPENFKLGPGNVKEKKERVSQFVESLTDNIPKYEKFVIGQKKNIKKLQSHDGISHIEKNLEQALNYKKITVLKQKINFQTHNKKQQSAKIAREQEKLIKFETNQFNLQKWSLIKIASEKEKDRQAMLRKKAWMATQWIANIKLKNAIRYTDNELDERILQREIKFTQNTMATKIQRTYLKFIKKKADSERKRDLRRIKVGLQGTSLLMYQMQMDRALSLVKFFLRDVGTKRAMYIQIKNHVIGVMKVQARFNEHNRKMKIRHEILSSAYKLAAQKMQMVLMKKKNKKLEKKLREVKPEVIQQILTRYQRFALDQHAYTWFSFRNKIKTQDFTTFQYIQFRFSLSERLEKSYCLQHNETSAVNYDPNCLGLHIDFLPPCLDPDAPESERLKEARWVEHKNELLYLDKIGDQCLDPLSLAQNHPCILNFYPSEEVLDKLIRRSIQIKDYREELWKGFHSVMRDGNRETWHPDELMQGRKMLRYVKDHLRDQIKQQQNQKIQRELDENVQKVE